jgi:CHAT domain-containing protein/tetratricopeptide (TPR) repeat protein
MWLALLLVLALAGCGWKQHSAEALYQEARALLHSEHDQDARTQTELALRKADPGSPLYLRLRLLRLEILVEQREIKLAREALKFQLPAGPQWTEEWARYRLCQSNIAFGGQQFSEARSYLDEAQRLAAGIGAPGLLGIIELRRARLAMQLGDLAGAESRLRHLMDEAARRKDPYLELRAKGNIGYMLLRQARYEEAMPWFEQALAMARAVGAADNEPRSMLNLGWCYYYLGELDKAQQLFRDAAPKFELEGNRDDTQICLGNIASTYFSRHEYDAAAANYKRALDMATELGDRPSRGFWLGNLARISIATGDWNQAERYNNEAWAIWKDPPDPRAEAYSIFNAGYIADGKKDYVRAEQLFRSVIRTASGDPVPLLNAHAGLAHVFADQGKNREAEAEYRATDAALEHQRSALFNDQDKLSYFSSLIEFYQDYVGYTMGRERPGDALEIVEASRARALVDRLSLAHTPRGASTAAGFERVAAANGSVLMSYWIAPRGSYLWVVTGSGVHVFPLPEEARIRAMVEAYDAFIQNVRDPLAGENRAGRELYDTLIAPAKGVLRKDAKIIVAPDGPLYALNFETLPVFDGTPHYWIEDVTLSITPSLGLLSLDRSPRGPAQRSLLLIGNPVSPVPQYPALEFAAQEMAGIEKNLSAFRQVVLEGPQAGRDAYLNSAPGGFEFIHFVAHAVSNASEPLDSAVILSRQGTQYKLSAKDVLGTRLNASLVTISACRSAGARTYAGEGLVGLTWAFLEAGAKNVIAGLWDVSDRSTADLVTRLYAGLARGADPAAALRGAKLEMIHAGGAYQKPYYWGPFELFTRQPQ